MKYFILLIFLTNSIYALSFEDLQGFWRLPKNEGEDLRIAQFFEKDSKMYAIALYPDHVDDKKRDSLNPNPVFRSRFLDEIIFVTNLQIDNQVLISGELYDPYKGHYYYLSGSLSQDNNTIEWTLSLDKLGLCSQKIIWHRVQNSEQYQQLAKTPIYLESKIVPNVLDH